MRPPPIEVYIPHVDLGRERWIREIAGSGLRSDILLQNIQKREFPNFRTTHLRICWYQENQNGNVVIGQDLFPSRVVIPPGAKVVVMHRTYGVRPYGNLVYCEARPTVTKPLDEPDEDEPKPDAFDPSPPRCPPPPPSPPRRPPQPRCLRLPPPLKCALPKTRPAKRSATKVHGGLFKKCEHPDCAFLVHSNPFIGAWGLGRLEDLLGPWRHSWAPGPPSPPKALPHLWGPSSFLWPWRTARLRGDTGENSSPWAASLASSSKRYEYGHDMPASPAQGNRGERVEDAGGGS